MSFNERLSLHNRSIRCMAAVPGWCGPLPPWSRRTGHVSAADAGDAPSSPPGEYTLPLASWSQPPSQASPPSPSRLLKWSDWCVHPARTAIREMRINIKWKGPTRAVPHWGRWWNLLSTTPWETSQNQGPILSIRQPSPATLWCALAGFPKPWTTHTAGTRYQSKFYNIYDAQEVPIILISKLELCTYNFAWSKMLSSSWEPHLSFKIPWEKK